MAPSVSNNLFDHMEARVDVDVLKAKNLEQDNILTKQAKKIKRMKSKLDLFQDKFKRAKFWE